MLFEKIGWFDFLIIDENGLIEMNVILDLNDGKFEIDIINNIIF